MPLLLELVVVLLGSQLNTAEIAIELVGSMARVEAHYDIGDSHELLLNMIRFPNQELHLIGPDVSSLESDTSSGLHRFRMAAITSPAVLRYEISGDLSRIPLAVPTQPANPGARAVTIRLSGFSGAAALAEGFPRFESREAGSAVARLDNVPGFVRLPPDQGDWSVSSVAEIAVVLLVVLASIYWLLRRRRQAIRSRPEGPR